MSEVQVCFSHAGKEHVCNAKTDEKLGDVFKKHWPHYDPNAQYQLQFANPVPLNLDGTLEENTVTDDYNLIFVEKKA